MRASLPEQRRRIGLAVADRELERRGPVVAFGVDVGASVQQQLHYIYPAAAGSTREWPEG